MMRMRPLQWSIMTRTLRTLVLGTALFGQTAKFSELQRREIPGTGRDGVTTVAVIPPGATSARHSHPGEDFGYLIEGTIVLMVDGHPPLTVHAGETFFTARGEIHNARNIGATVARAVDTYVIDKGKPGITPAP